MLDNLPPLLTATDLKQYTYCPRKCFFGRCLPGFRPRMPKMDDGRDAHAAESSRQARRSLRPYGLVEGQRRFDVNLTAPLLGLSGRADEVIITPEAVYPVDYKLSEQVHDSFVLQLAAYGLMLEEAWGLAAPAGFIVLLDPLQVERIEIGESLRAQVQASLCAMRAMLAAEREPPPLTDPARCAVCEYRRLCADADR